MATITSQIIDVTGIYIQGAPWFSDKAVLAQETDDVMIKDIFDMIVRDSLGRNVEVLYLTDSEFVFNHYLDWEDITIVKIEN